MSDPTEPGSAESGSTAEAQMPNEGVPASVEALQAALVASEAAAAESRNQHLRVLAEFDNYRKRAARELENAHRYAVERFAQDLLPALDGFALAQQNAASADAKSLLEGQAATLRLLMKAFEKAGISVVAPERGSPFNPEHHEAMVAQPTAEHPANSVLETVQTGFLLHGRLLRPARVIVARAPDA
jgi:molecular chaperone GrpE